ncbi:MAG: MFS transporter [Chlamydiales bacterium]|nr:MFS transporter [Chlamydiales bacterium]
MRSITNYLAAISGNILKHYDQSVYGFLIPFLAPLFFPHEDPVYSLLAAFALLPLGFIAKPLGAYVFGYFGDRYGRKKCLVVTLFGMGCTTASIGCLPSFEEAGWTAPLLLGLFRLAQSFFAAGETTGGALFLLEQTTAKKRGLMSSLFDASGILGVLMAAVGVYILGQTHWRWLFWIGGVSAILGLMLRKTTSETYIAPEKKTWSRSDWASMLTIAAVSGFSYANYYLLFTFLTSFLPLVSHVSAQEALALNTLLLSIDFLLLPCFGYLSLHISKEKLILTATMLGAMLTYPLFLLLDGASAWTAAGVRVAFTVIGVCLAAPYHAWAMETAPEEKRFTICSMGSAVGGRLIGAPMPILSLWLYHQTGSVGAAGIPLVLTALLASGAIILSKRAVVINSSSTL